MKYSYAACIIVAFVTGVLLIRGLEIAGWFCVAATLALFVIFGWSKRAVLRAWWLRKINEWKNDARAVGLWFKLALSSNKDKHATATMAHQQAFLTGRLMSPMNLFPLAIGAILLLPLIGGIQEWRINRVKAERDAPCSEREISRNDDGEFRTHREACATLGDTIEAAHSWRARAHTLEAQLIHDVAAATLEGQEALQRETNRRERAAATARRQGRRNNESIASTIGAGPPNLERSVCELAGGVDCAATGPAASTAAPAVTGDLSSGTGDANTTGSAASPG